MVKWDNLVSSLIAKPRRDRVVSYQPQISADSGGRKQSVLGGRQPRSSGHRLGKEREYSPPAALPSPPKLRTWQARHRVHRGELCTFWLVLRREPTKTSSSPFGGAGWGRGEFTAKGRHFDSALLRFAQDLRQRFGLFQISNLRALEIAQIRRGSDSEQHACTSWVGQCGHRSCRG
jgi:hypothetical protein